MSMIKFLVLLLVTVMGIGIYFEYNRPPEPCELPKIVTLTIKEGKIGIYYVNTTHGTKTRVLGPGSYAVIESAEIAIIDGDKWNGEVFSQIEAEKE